MQCVITENNLIKLIHYGEAKKTAHNSQIVKAKEKLQLSHGGHAKVKHQTQKKTMKALVRAVMMSDDWPTVCN